MLTATWLATWDSGPVAAVKLHVEIEVDGGAVQSLRVTAYDRDSVSVEAREIDWAVVEPFLEGLVGLSWEDTDCIEKFDGDELAWEAVNVEEAGRLAHLLREAAERLRREQGGSSDR